jgi:hypothetical protein
MVHCQQHAPHNPYASSHRHAPSPQCTSPTSTAPPRTPDTPHPPPRTPHPTQAEPDIFATTGSDRSIALYDLRSSTPIRKLVMQTRCNALAWNPMEAFNFCGANEDCNLYTYDMRKLQSAACVHKVGRCGAQWPLLLHLRGSCCRAG